MFGNGKKIPSKEMDYLQRLSTKSWLERAKNENNRRLVPKERIVIEGTERKQLVWYGHVNRVEDERLLKTVMKHISKGKEKEDDHEIHCLVKFQVLYEIYNMANAKIEEDN